MPDYSPIPVAAAKWLRDAAAALFTMNGDTVPDYSPENESASQYLRDSAQAVNTLVGN